MATGADSSGEDHVIDSLEIRRELRGQTGHVRLIGDVHDPAVNGSWIGPGEVGPRFNHRSVSVDEDNGRALRGESGADREPDASCTAQDHRDLTLERQIHSQSVDSP